MGRLAAGQRPQHIPRLESVVDGLRVLVRIVKHEEDLVVQEVHVDHARDKRLLAADRVFDRRNLGGAGRDVENADGLAGNAFVHEALRNDAGRQFQRGPHMDDIIHQ